MAASISRFCCFCTSAAATKFRRRNHRRASHVRAHLHIKMAAWCFWLRNHNLSLRPLIPCGCVDDLENDLENKTQMLDFENVTYTHNGLITLSYPLRENLRQMDRLIAPGENLSGLCDTTQAIVLKCERISGRWTHWSQAERISPAYAIAWIGNQLIGAVILPHFCRSLHHQWLPPKITIKIGNSSINFTQVLDGKK